jgi:hypothetical protein
MINSTCTVLTCKMLRQKASHAFSRCSEIWLFVITQVWQFLDIRLGVCCIYNDCMRFNPLPGSKIALFGFSEFIWLSRDRYATCSLPYVIIGHHAPYSGRRLLFTLYGVPILAQHRHKCQTLSLGSCSWPCHNELTRINICNPHRILHIISFGNKIPLEYFVDNVPVCFEHCSTSRYDIALLACTLFIYRKSSASLCAVFVLFSVIQLCHKLGMRAPFRSRHTTLLWPNCLLYILYINNNNCYCTIGIDR